MNRSFKLKAYTSNIQYADWCIALQATYDETAAPKFIENLFDRVKDSNVFKVMEGFLGDIKSFVTEVANETKLGIKEIALALSHKDIYALFKAISFDLAKLLKSISEATKLLKSSFIRIFEIILKSGVLDDVKNGTARLDKVLAEYPIIKKAAGPALAGMLFMIWINSIFTGHPDIDLDMSAIVQAFHGTYSLEEVFLSPDGLAMIALFVANFASGGALSMTGWLGSNAYNVILALVYTGVLKNPKLKPLVNSVKSKIPMSKFKVDRQTMKLATS